MSTMNERLLEARKAKGYRSAAAACRAFGWKELAYSKHENGTRGFSSSVEKYAKAYSVSVEWLITGKGSNLPKDAISLNGKGHHVPVLGQVQAGAWRPVGEIIELHNVTKFVTFYNADYPIDKQYALKVVGDSMNLVIFENSFVICINIDEGISSPTHGDLVIAEHIEDGQVETTVKKLSLSLDGTTLLPCSSNADHKPLVLNNLPKGNEVKIKARVIGAVQEF